MGKSYKTLALALLALLAILGTAFIINYDNNFRYDGPMPSCQPTVLNECADRNNTIETPSECLEEDELIPEVQDVEGMDSSTVNCSTISFSE